MKWWKLKEEISGVEKKAESNARGLSTLLWVWSNPTVWVWWRWSFWGHGWLVPSKGQIREFDD